MRSDDRTAALEKPAQTEVLRMPEADDGDGRTAASSTLDGKAPSLAPDVELLGRYQGSGFKDPPYLVRRADGQMVQIPGLLYAIAERLDGSRSYEEVAASVTEAARVGVSDEQVRFLVEKKLQPLGLVPGTGGDVADVETPNPLLALRFRAKVIPEGVVHAITTLFLPSL